MKIEFLSLKKNNKKGKKGEGGEVCPEGGLGGLDAASKGEPSKIDWEERGSGY